MDLANELEPFLLDVVNPEKDPGEKWLIGLRTKKAKPEERTADDVAKDALAKAAGKSEEPPPEPEKIPVYFILRRMPNDMSNRLAQSYRDEREIQDIVGNKRTEYYFKPEKEQALKEEKALWMLRDSENLVVGVTDEEGAALYTHALGRTVNVGETILVDGHWNDELRSHYIRRYEWVLTTIMMADRQYRSVQAQKDERLQGNLFRGSNSNSARSGK